MTNLEVIQQLHENVVLAQSLLAALFEVMGTAHKGQYDMLRSIEMGLNTAEMSARQLEQDLQKPWLYPTSGTA